MDMFNTIDYASRRCHLNGEWDKNINVSNCESEEFRDVAIKVSL